jgi:5-methylcytosine-specific restriction endonuclease McrA
MTDYPEWFLQRISAIQNKRPRIVAEHILEHGSVTTEELTTLYGYIHAPRAARDLREAGIPLETFRVKNAEGRSIAVYRFGNLEAIRRNVIGGRKAFPKGFKQQLINRDGLKCAICNTVYEARYLQIDHRVPYEIAGDPNAGEHAIEDHLLVCAECNRAKSWSCEHCANWLKTKSPDICLSCYWGNPSHYNHIALRPIRRLDVTWTEREVEMYEKLKTQADALDQPIADYVKQIINHHINLG